MICLFYLLCSSTIRDKIIPHAVSWFTGEAVQEDEFDGLEEDEDDDDDDEDMDDDEDEDEEDDEDDDDEDEEDEEESKSKSKRKTKVNFRLFSFFCQDFWLSILHSWVY